MVRSLLTVLTLWVVVATPVLAQPTVDRFPIMENESWGYIDAEGAVIIKPQFDDASFFSDGLARVKTDDGYAFINPDGDIVLTPDVAFVGSFSDGLARFAAESGGPYGYMNTSGETVIDPQFKRAGSFSEGLAAVYVGSDQRAEAKFGYIDRSGAFAIKPQFWGARQFSNGLAPVLIDGFVRGKWGFIDRSGALVIDPSYSEALPFSDDHAAIAMGDGFDATWGFIDIMGTTVIEPKFQNARSFAGGMAPVEDKFDDWKYIGSDGEPVSRNEYEYAEPFRGSLARVATTAGGGGRGHQGGEMTFYTGVDDENWRYVDMEENQVWPAPESPSQSERPPQAERPSPNKRPSSTNRPSPRATSSSSPLTDSLAALLPQTIASTYKKQRVRRHPSRPMLRTSYVGPDDSTFAVQMAYGKQVQEVAMSEAERNEIEQRSIGGRSVYVRNSASGLQGVILPGSITLSIEAPGASLSAREDALAAALEAFDPDALADVTLEASTPDLDVAAPAGYSTLTTSWKTVDVGLAHPEGWHSIDSFQMTGFFQSITLFRKEAATDSIRARRRSIDSSRRPSLIVPNNVILTLSVTDGADGSKPEDYLDRMLGHNQLKNGEEVQPIQSVSLDNGSAAMTAFAGSDAAGRPARLEYWVLERNGVLLMAHILQPGNDASRFQEKVRTILGSLVIKKK